MSFLIACHLGHSITKCLASSGADKSQNTQNLANIGRPFRPTSSNNDNDYSSNDDNDNNIDNNNYNNINNNNYIDNNNNNINNNIKIIIIMTVIMIIS